MPDTWNQIDGHDGTGCHSRYPDREKDLAMMDTRERTSRETFQGHKGTPAYHREQHRGHDGNEVASVVRHSFGLVGDEFFMRKPSELDDGLMDPILFKPKNMHQKTFDRLRREADAANDLSWVIMGRKVGIFL